MQRGQGRRLGRLAATFLAICSVGPDYAGSVDFLPRQPAPRGPWASASQAVQQVVEGANVICYEAGQSLHDVIFARALTRAGKAATHPPNRKGALPWSRA